MIALPVGALEGRLALAMAELQSAVAGQRAVAEALAGIVAEVSTKTQPADLRHLATGLASNAMRATMLALVTRDAASALSTVAALIEGAS
jgi:hypothetical protein